MNHSKINLPFENRLHLNRKAGTLVHAFGEGYFITDEYGRCMSSAKFALLS